MVSIHNLKMLAERLGEPANLATNHSVPLFEETSTVRPHVRINTEEQSLHQKFCTVQAIDMTLAFIFDFDHFYPQFVALEALLQQV